MSNTSGTRAWRFLKRNPHYIEPRREAPAAAPDEAAPFPIRARTAADRKAAAWGLMAWEDVVSILLRTRYRSATALRSPSGTSASAVGGCASDWARRCA